MLHVCTSFSKTGKANNTTLQSCSSETLSKVFIFEEFNEMRVSIKHHQYSTGNFSYNRMKA